MPRRARHYIANQPYHVVIYMNVMYAGFAGAKTCSTLKGSEPFNFDVLGQGWVEVGNLQVGQLIETKDGKPAKVKSLKDTGVITTTYNFDVKDIDSYYVSAAMVLVHNNCGIDNVDNFIANNTQRLNQKLGKKIGEGRLPFERSREGIEKAKQTVADTLNSTSAKSKPFTNSNGDTVFDVYSEKTGFTVRIRENGAFDTLIDAKTDKF